MKIASWSGPRNLSTAMMYSFASRSDTAILDEPFYAAYLQKTKLDHPMRDQILDSQPKSFQEVIKSFDEPITQKKEHLYIKLICNHILDGVSLKWAKSYKNIFLVRHPARVISSYNKKRENPTLNDIGFIQQHQIYEELGGFIIESSDILKYPEKALKKICNYLELKFDPSMLSWPKGGHANEGVWGKHWYNTAHLSTNFESSEAAIQSLPGHLRKVYESAIPFYERLIRNKIII